MKYISDNRLNKIKDDITDGTSKLFVHTLITLCKELPQEQWQTIEEFKENPVDGWCHICFGSEKNVDKAYYASDKFWWHDMHDMHENWDDVKITHVIPIKTPGAPK